MADWLEIGDVGIGRVVEWEGAFQRVYDFFPDATEEAIAPHRDWLEPDALEPGTDMLRMPIQSYVVRTPQATVLIDSCIGNHKTVPWFDGWNAKTDGNYLAGLAALGVHPEQIDFVLCTHLHVDHSGWNTRLVDGRWVPTFPNARYVLSRRECEHAERLWREFDDQTYPENVQPVLEAGQADLVEDDHALDRYVWLEPTPGHTAGHCAIHVADGGAEIVVSGDLIHSPVQCRYPHWNYRFDADKEAAARTRIDFLSRYSDSAVRVLTAHFPLPSGGAIVSDGDAFHIHYEEW